MRNGRRCLLAVWVWGSGCALGWGEVSVSSPTPALIQIAVEVVEIDEMKSTRLGLSWLNTLTLTEGESSPLLRVGTFSRRRLYADLQALFADGAADLLANPKLVTRDGTTASFHSGGELPYIVTSGFESATVEFKPYGVELRISPRLEDSGRINLDVDAEVSAPDDQNSVQLSGNQVPGILSRQVNARLTVAPGATLTLAGLIQHQKFWRREGLPVLGRIPVLGYLFSRKVQARRRTSIVVFLTPSLLDPAAYSGEHPLPRGSGSENSFEGGLGRDPLLEALEPHG